LVVIWNYINVLIAMEASNFKFYVACVLEGDGDSEPEDTRPTTFRKAGSESSAIESKIMKVSSGLFIYGVRKCHLWTGQ